MIKVHESHLGGDATREEAERMIELLRQRGYNVGYGSSLREEESANNISDEVWRKCLEQVCREYVQKEMFQN